MATRIQGYRDVIINGPGHVQVFCKSYYPKCRACATVTVKTEGKILKTLSKFSSLLTEALNILSPNLSSEYLCIPYSNLHDEDEAYYKQNIVTDKGGNKDCHESSTNNCDNDNVEVIEVGDDEFINKVIKELITTDESFDLPAKNPFSVSSLLSCNDALEETQMEMDLRNPPRAFEEFKGKIEFPLTQGQGREDVELSDPNNRMDNQRLGKEHIVPGDTNPSSPNTTGIEADTDAVDVDEGYKSSFISTVTEVEDDTSIVSTFDLAIVSSAQYPTTTSQNKNHDLLSTATDTENNHDQPSQPRPLILDQETSSDSLGESETGIRRKENTRLVKPDAVADTEYCRGNFSCSDVHYEKNRKEGKRKIENTLFPPTESSNQLGASFSGGGGQGCHTSDLSNESGGNNLNASPANSAVNQEPVDTTVTVAGTENLDVLPYNEERYATNAATDSTREESSPLEWSITSSQLINEKQSGSQNGRGKKADVYYIDPKQRHETFKKSGLANAIMCKALNVKTRCRFFYRAEYKTKSGNLMWYQCGDKSILPMNGPIGGSSKKRKLTQ